MPASLVYQKPRREWGVEAGVDGACRGAPERCALLALQYDTFPKLGVPFWGVSIITTIVYWDPPI